MRGRPACMGERGGDGGYARRPEPVGQRPVPQLYILFIGIKYAAAWPIMARVYRRKVCFFLFFLIYTLTS